MRYQTSKEAAKYVYETIQKVDPTAEILDEKNIMEMIQEEIIDKVELDLEPHDITMLEEHKQEENFFDTYLREKLHGYNNILIDTVNDIIEEYILDE